MIAMSLFNKLADGHSSNELKTSNPSCPLSASTAGGSRRLRTHVRQIDDGILASISLRGVVDLLEDSDVGVGRVGQMVGVLHRQSAAVTETHTSSYILSCYTALSYTHTRANGGMGLGSSAEFGSSFTKGLSLFTVSRNVSTRSFSCNEVVQIYRQLLGVLYGAAR